MSHGDNCSAPAEDGASHREPLVLERVHKQSPSCASAVSCRLRKCCSCTPQRAKAKIVGCFPILTWLPGYRFKEWILGDVMSGLIVGILLVPQSIAYSLLASLDPVYGIYTSFFSCVIYSFVGTSRHISVGIFGVLCLLVGQVVDRELALAGYVTKNGADNVTLLHGWGNDTDGMGCDRSCYAITVAATVTFTAGVYQVLMGLLQAGFISVYLSDSLLSGFATGSSLTILTSQVKHLLGLKFPRPQGYFTLFKTWYRLLANLPQTNICDLITSLICLLILIPTKELNNRFKSKLKAPIPFELFVVVIATVASHFGHFNAEYGSSIAGYIPTGFQPPLVPMWSLIPNVAMDAFSIAVVGFAITVSLSEMFAKKHNYTVDPNQELYAIGVCNILPSFFRCFTTSAALTKTLVKESTGCQSQVSGLISGLVLLLVLLVIAPLFSSLQKSVLAVIIVVNLRGALQKFCDVPRMWRANKADATVWLVTMATSGLVNTELGLLVGALVSVLCVLGRTQRTRVRELGRAAGRERYEDLKCYCGLETHAGVAVLRYEAPIYFANQSLFKKSLYRTLGVDPAKERLRRVRFEKKSPADKECAAADSSVNMMAPPSGRRSVVLDCSAIVFLDSAGVEALKEVRKDYRELGITLVLAQCSPTVLDDLDRCGYFPDKKAGSSGEVYFTIADAVHHVQDLHVPNGDHDSCCRE